MSEEWKLFMGNLYICGNCEQQPHCEAIYIAMTKMPGYPKNIKFVCPLHFQEEIEIITREVID